MILLKTLRLNFHFTDKKRKELKKLSTANQILQPHNSFTLKITLFSILLPFRRV